MDIKHDGDCTIYESMHQSDGLPWCGICTCGAGWRKAIEALHSDEISGGLLFLQAKFKYMLSEERRKAFEDSISLDQKAISKTIANKLIEPKFEDIPDYGDHITLKEFEDSVLSNMFTNDDGSARLATSTQMSNVYITPSTFYYLVTEGELDKLDKWATHVVWFNK